MHYTAEFTDKGSLQQYHRVPNFYLAHVYTLLLYFILVFYYFLT
jgi:hypothetical protein